MARRVEPNPDQMSTDDFTSLESLHQVDMKFYHRDCDGQAARRQTATKDAIRTVCPVCGLWVTTTRSAVDTMKVR